MTSISNFIKRINSVIRIFSFLAQYWAKKLIYSLKRNSSILKRIHLKSFPAVHIKRLGFWDLLLTFSSELVIFFIALSIVSFNLYFFKLKPESTDKSLASIILTYHHPEGDKVYGKIASIKTVIEQKNNPFIQEAYAETTPFLESAGEEEDDSANNLVISDSNSIVKPNPDSVSELISKQVKVHTVAEGETLSGIAKEYKISTDTIVWANKLPSHSVKPGWQLLILPTTGVLVKADSNTTLPDIAHKYNCDLEKIISYNGLDGADDIEEGKIIIAPGCKVPPPPQIAKPTTPKNNKGTTKTPKLTQLGKHFFPLGYCTYYVASRMEIDFGGNANVWHINAERAGYDTGKIPMAGAAAVTTDGPRRYGHVVFVEKVTEDYIEVSEMNFKGWNVISKRKIPINSRSIVKYIYPKK